jgi:glutathione S-transferase
VQEAREKVLGGLDRLEAELDGGEYLVGDRFSVADLTAAALLYPLVLPDEGPWQPVRTAAFLELQDSVRDRPGFRWVEETFRRRRRDAGV